MFELIVIIIFTAAFIALLACCKMAAREDPCRGCGRDRCEERQQIVEEIEGGMTQKECGAKMDKQEAKM